MQEIDKPVNIFNHPVFRSILKKAEDEILDKFKLKINLTPSETEKNINLLSRRKALLKSLITEVYDVSWDDIISNKRYKHIIHARHCYMYLCRYVLGYTLDRCGYEINRDHTSVMYAVQKIHGFYKVGDYSIENVELIKNKMMEIQ